MQMINEVTTRDELADLVGVSYRKLTYILYKKHVENMYTSFEIPKKNGYYKKNFLNQHFK